MVAPSSTSPEMAAPVRSPPRKTVTVPPQECGRFCPTIRGGEDPDPLIRQRRDKVKEVSTGQARLSTVRWHPEACQ